MRNSGSFKTQKVDFLQQKVFPPQQSTKTQRPSGEDTAECSSFFTTIQTKSTRRIFIHSVFYKEIKNPVTGSRAPSLHATCTSMSRLHDKQGTGHTVQHRS